MSNHKLRPISPSDAQWIFEACQDQQIQYWTTIPKPYLLEHAQAFAAEKIKEYKIWVIQDQNDKAVGVISIHGVDENGNAEIGYWVAPWGRGKNAVVDAIAEVENFAYNQKNIKTIQATISDLNEASQKVAIRSGLQRVEASCKMCPAGEQETPSSIYRKVLAI